MPSAVRSGGGRVLGSTPGPAFGDPLSATYNDLRSALTLMPRGRLPSGAVAMTIRVAASMTVRSPEASLVTYTRTRGTAGPLHAVASMATMTAGAQGVLLTASSLSSGPG